MPTQCIVDAEKDADMKSLSKEEAIVILSDMKIDIPLPKAAVTQRERNAALDMAIIALSCSEIPNSADSISRQAAIDAIENAFDRETILNRFVRKIAISAVRLLPSAQPEQRWIPVTERLPEHMEPVLTWDGGVYCVEKRIPYIRDDDGEPIEGDWWVSDDYDEYDSDYYPNLRDGACIAWQPLPEPPYQEGERDG